MLPRGGFDAKASRRRQSESHGASDAIAGLVHADPAKTLVMTFIGRLIADGFAEWKMVDNGEIELRFSTGETYTLGQKAVVRLV
jgi:hypothetical protein